MTGQHPRRRETDREAKRRVEALESRRAERMEKSFPLPIAWKLLQPRINARGLEYPALALNLRGPS